MIGYFNDIHFKICSQMNICCANVNSKWCLLFTQRVKSLSEAHKKFGIYLGSL